jgi:hypothetical protein
MKAFALPLLLLLIAGCARKQFLVAAEPSADQDAPALEQRPVLGGAEPADSLVVSLQRTPCFGTCPAYTITVYRSGYATYFGSSHVQLEGLHEARIGLDTLHRILADAERSGFYQFQDKYDRDVSDLPSSILRVVGNGRDKRVLARIGTPEAFKLLFARVEELLLPVVWTPVPNAR